VTSSSPIRFAVVAALAAILLSSSSCSDAPRSGAPPADGTGAPWQRTEERAACRSFDPLRRPFFGDLHVHTRFSADAYIFGTKVGPRDAYAFAQGAGITLADDDELQTRSTRLDRPLDFAAVTDHSEFFGEVNLCITPGSPLYDTEMCGNLRKPDSPDDRFDVTVQWLYPAGIDNPPKSHAFCSTPGVDCDADAASVWQEMQAAAEEAYDRSDACTFTSFLGYEHTASPFGRHRHRNVIFRNHVVPAFASSQLETAADGWPQGLWTAVERDCLDAGSGCDAVVIPHNSNLSGGEQFADPADGAEAQRRQDREPLVELFQLKGNSECRFDLIAGEGVGTSDELCSFEQLTRSHEGPDNDPPPDVRSWPRRNLVRNALEDGLALEERLGANPFRTGFIGSTDNHDGASGSTDEKGWQGGQGNGDASPQRRISRQLQTNPGGLAGVWAEENSRDAIFAALARRETFATSGTRSLVRLFGGALDGVSCASPDFVARAYATGTPMGGELGDVRGGASPRFAVLAVKDPGTADAPGADLQRIQIVKGWLDPGGAARERVFDVAGTASDGTDLDRASCTPAPAAAELCAVWEDPEFDPAQRAFYYARVLEVPTCRWSTRTCKEQGVDPFAADCAAQAARAGEPFADCCLTRELGVEPVVQERTWSSPIWYRLESIAALSGGIVRGRDGRTGRLDLVVVPGRLPDDVLQGAAPLTVTLSSGTVVARVAYAAGEVPLEEDGSGRTVLRVVSDQTDVSSLGAGDATLHVQLESGAYRAEHVRRWRGDDAGLAPVTGGPA
jgi:hypothetical protein